MNKEIIGIDVALEHGDKSVIVHGIPDDKGGFKVITIDEWATWPEYKWWLQPIKWWKLRHIMKTIGKNSKGVWLSTPPQPNPFWKKSTKE